MTENVTMSIPIVTVSEIALPRWMTPFAKHLFGIPTHMTAQERLLLFQTALALPQGFTIVEIGSYLGASTAFLGFAALHRSGFVHAVDPWTNDAMEAEGRRDTWERVPAQHRTVRPLHRPAPRLLGRRAGARTATDVRHAVRRRRPQLRRGRDRSAGLAARAAAGRRAGHARHRRAWREAGIRRTRRAAPGATAAIVDRLLVCRPGPAAGGAI